MSGFRVLEPGILSQFQDEGRFGHHAMGLTTGGPVDGEAFYWANRLAGNQRKVTFREQLTSVFTISRDAVGETNSR